MLVRMLVGERTVRAEGAGWVVGVVHARPQIGVVEPLVLVVEAEGVAYLLAHHKLPPGGRVVLRHREVRVVHLSRALRDVFAAYPDLSEAEPVVLAILCVADLDPPPSRIACRATGSAGDDIRVQYGRYTPVGRGL